MKPCGESERNLNPVDHRWLLMPPLQRADRLPTPRPLLYSLTVKPLMPSLLSPAGHAQSIMSFLVIFSVAACSLTYRNWVTRSETDGLRLNSANVAAASRLPVYEDMHMHIRHARGWGEGFTMRTGRGREKREWEWERERERERRAIDRFPLIYQDKPNQITELHSEEMLYLERTISWTRNRIFCVKVRHCMHICWRSVKYAFIILELFTIYSNIA